MNDFISPPWEQDANPSNPTINPKKLQGLWIPAEYLYANDLSKTEMLLLSYIKMLDQDKHCYASNKYLSELMKKNESWIRNILVKLKKKNYIATISRNPRVIMAINKTAAELRGIKPQNH
jgi:hypothetical protein